MQSVSLCVFLSSALCLFFCGCARRAAQFVIERVLLLRLRDRSDSQTPSSHEWGHLSPLPQSSCMSVNRANWIILFGINKPQRLRTSSRFHTHLCCYCFFSFLFFEFFPSKTLICHFYQRYYADDAGIRLKYHGSWGVGTSKWLPLS